MIGRRSRPWPLDRRRASGAGRTGASDGVGPAVARALHRRSGRAPRRGRRPGPSELLRRAIEERPQPGVQVPTYGTNFEPQYFPYLRLAEAFLLLDESEEAAEALQASARFGVAPAEERAALEARVRALIEAAQALRPDDGSDPRGGPRRRRRLPPRSRPRRSRRARPRPAAAVEPRRPPRTDPADAPTPPAPRSPLPRSERRPLRSPPSPGPALDITSDPPGARVFLDDTPVGRTDPETGRLSLQSPGRGPAPGPALLRRAARTSSARSRSPASR